MALDRWGRWGSLKHEACKLQRPAGRWIWALIFVGCLLTGWESRAQSPSKDPKKGTAQISGRVTLKGAPLRGATVILRPSRQSGGDSALRSRTDELGAFRLTGVSAGQYLLTAMAAGLVAPLESTSSGIAGRVVKISDGENLENLELVLKRGSVITGRITDSGGRPLIEEAVRLTKLDETSRAAPLDAIRFFRMYRTDDRGIYRLYGLPAGRYLVSVGGAPRFGAGPNSKNYPQTFYPGTTDESKTKVIELGEGDEATGIDISVGEPKTFYQALGRVIDAEDDEPLDGVEIQIGAARSDSNGFTIQGGGGNRSGKGGEFRFNRLAPGRYAVFAAGREGSEYYSDPVGFEVLDSDVKGIEIRAKRGATIDGVVVVEGTSDPAVLAKLPLFGLSAQVGSNQGPMPAVLSRISANGSFQLTGLYPGRAQIMLATYGGEREFTIIRLERGGNLQPAEIEIGPGEQIQGLRVIVRPVR